MENTKMRFFSPKHKENNRYNGVFIAKDIEDAKSIAIQYGVIKEEDINNYEFEDITLEMSAKDRLVQGKKGET